MTAVLPKTDAQLRLITIVATLLAVALLLPLHTLAFPPWATAAVIFAAAALIGAELAVARLYTLHPHAPTGPRP